MAFHFVSLRSVLPHDELDPEGGTAVKGVFFFKKKKIYSLGSKMGVVAGVKGVAGEELNIT